MKQLLFLIIFGSSFAFASGTTVGNGGNTVVCKDANGQISSIEVLDYFEVRLSGRALQLNQSLTDYRAILVELFQRWLRVAPVRMDQYMQWLEEFENEAGIYEGIQIPEIPDTGTIAIPAGCGLVPVAFQRPDEQILPGVKRYVINKDIWKLMDPVQKAGLVLHELIYREGIKAEHKDSFATRYLNGYFASSLPDRGIYTSIISQAKLRWVEYGEGMILQFREGELVLENGSIVANDVGYWFYGNKVDNRYFSLQGTFNFWPCFKNNEKASCPDLTLGLSENAKGFVFNLSSFAGAELTKFEVKGWTNLVFRNELTVSSSWLIWSVDGIHPAQFVSGVTGKILLDDHLSWIRTADDVIHTGISAISPKADGAIYEIDLKNGGKLVWDFGKLEYVQKTR